MSFKFCNQIEIQENPYLYFPIIQQNVYNYFGFHQANLNYHHCNQKIIMTDTILIQRKQNKITEQDVQQSIKIEIKPNKIKKQYISRQKYQQIEQYLPQNIRGKDSKQYYEKQKRKILTRLIHHALIFLTKRQKSGYLVKKLLKLKNKKQLFQKYYFLQQQKKKNLSPYTNLKTLIENITSCRTNQADNKQQISVDEQILFCSIYRRVILFFLSNQSTSLVICSRKIMPVNRIHYFNAKREIIKHLQTNKYLIQHIQ